MSLAAIAADGLEGLDVASDRMVEVGPAESRWVAVRLQVPYGSAAPGSHPIHFDVTTVGGDAHVQYYGRHFGIVIRPARSDRPHDPYTAGLHHLCLRVESIDDVRDVAAQLQAAGIAATDAALHGDYAPD